MGNFDHLDVVWWVEFVILDIAMWQGYLWFGNYTAPSIVAPGGSFFLDAATGY